MRPFVALAVALALTACGEDPPPASDEEACMAIEMGPYMQIAATISRDISTPPIADNANAYTVTLTASGFGYVKIEATAGKHIVYLDRGLMVNALEGAGTPASISSGTSSAACTAIQGRHEVTLAAGTVFFGLMSDGGAPVNVVLSAP